MVETIEVDKFEDQDAGTISAVSDMHGIMFVPDTVPIEMSDANTIFLFIPVDPIIDIDWTNHIDPDNPTTQKNVLFALSLPDLDNKDSYVLCKESVHIITPRQQT